jgi:hypothetical protein
VGSVVFASGSEIAIFLDLSHVSYGLARRRRISFGKVPPGRAARRQLLELPTTCLHSFGLRGLARWRDVLRAAVKNLVIVLPNEERSACNPFGGLRETYLRRVLGPFDRDRHAEIVIFPFTVLASNVENACSVNPVGALH